MTNKTFLLLIFVLSLASCNNNRTQENPKPETPKALEDKSASYDVISKRSDGDLVESIYNELVSKNSDLKKLEDKIDELNKGKRDSTSSFNKFNEKNQAYFISADWHIAGIKDSLLREKMKVLIASNLTNYNSSISKHKELLKIIENKNLTIADLHIIVKIVNTLPLIDKYQKDNLPGTKTFEGYIKQQDEAIKLADTLTKND